MRWWPIFQRNLLVWRKLAIPRMIGNIPETLMPSLKHILPSPPKDRLISRGERCQSKKNKPQSTSMYV